MSRKGMGGAEYDALLKGIEKHPRTTPGIFICDRPFVRQLLVQFGKPIPKELADRGYADVEVLGVPVWIDNRFTEPVFISKKND